MKRVLVAIAALFLFIIAAPTDAFDPYKLLKSVRPLTIPVIESIPVGDEGESTQRASFRNVCSVTSINPVVRYWLTAAHCVSDLEQSYHIMGEVVKVVMRDVPHDIAILQTTQATAPALKLANKEPRYSDNIAVMGYPWGWTSPIYSPGVVMVPKFQPWPNDPRPDWRAHFMLISSQGAPGNSGSSVVNNKHEIVSVVQIGWNRTWSVLGTAPYDHLSKYRSYWQDE